MLGETIRRASDSDIEVMFDEDLRGLAGIRTARPKIGHEKMDGGLVLSRSVPPGGRYRPQSTSMAP